jgi:hypothetical protein
MKYFAKILSVLLILSNVFLFAPAAQAALSVTARSETGIATNGGAYTTTLNTVSGHLVVVMLTNQTANNISSVTDTIGNTYTRVGSELSGGGNLFNIFYAVSTSTNASNVITVTLTGFSSYRTIVAYDISGQVLNSVPLNTFATSSANSNSITSGTITLQAPSEIITAIMIQTPPITGGSGYTLTNFNATGDTNAYFADEYHVTSSSEAATATGTGGGNFTIFAASFMAQSSSCGFGSPITGGQCRGYLTATGSHAFIVPSDWNSSSNSIETIGGGASGDAAAQGYPAPGGGGGAWNKQTNVALTPGGSVTYSVGAGGAAQSTNNFDIAGNVGSDSWFCNSTSNCSSITGTAVQVGSKGGGVSAGSGAAAPGGVGTSGVGSSNNSGGASGSAGLFSDDASGGGGAGGSSGAGVAGTNESTFQSASNGGAGDAGSGGAGGTGGNGSTAGSKGTEYDSLHGSGGGGGGSAPNASFGGSFKGGAAGKYGAGGGGGEDLGSGTAVSGAGAQGIIVVTYTPGGGSGGSNAPRVPSKHSFYGGYFRQRGGSVKFH